MLQEELGENQATLAVGVQFGVAEVPLSVAVLASNDPVQTSEDAVPEVDDLLNPDVRPHGVLYPAIPSHRGLAPIDPLLGPAGISSDENVWIETRSDRLPITAPDP